MTQLSVLCLPEVFPCWIVFELLWNALWNWNTPFSLYPNIVVSNVWEIHTTLNKVLEKLGEDYTHAESCIYQGRASTILFLTSPSLPYDTGFQLSLLSQTHTITTATFTLVHLFLWHSGILLWQSGIRLCLKHLIFSLGTRDIWSTKEIVQRFLYLHRNLVQTPNFLVPFKISRHEHYINLNFLREYHHSSWFMLYSGNHYSNNLKMYVFCFSQRYFLFFH